MPEYLAPGVYVEEIEIGAKPIEGVSTSTAGMVGMTQRGPTTGLPKLVTGFEDFRRKFGGYLKANGGHHYLPYAVQGFFENGGQRVYIKRVPGKNAKPATDNAGLLGGIVTRLQEDALKDATDVKLLTLRGIQKDTELTFTQVKNGETTGPFKAKVTVYDGKVGKVTLDKKLDNTYEAKYTTVVATIAGAPAKSKVAVSAIDPGTWGNTLGVQVSHVSRGRAEVKGLAKSAGAAKFDIVQLSTASNFYAGAVIEFDRGTAKVYKKVTKVIGNNIQLKTGFDAATDLNPAAGTTATIAVTCEFRLVVSYGQVTENYEYLTLDDTTSYYYYKAITDKSKLISVTEAAKDSASENPFNMPSAANGLQVPMVGGDDGTAPGDKDYIGEDNGPGKRTGLKAMLDIDNVSIVAVPGMSSQPVQNAMITHCELLKDRFAIIDPAGNKDIQGIQSQRDLYDSKYAALYYPWIKIYDTVTEKNILVPPSGHMAGIYARSDTERGVHKAPANEKIRGVVDVEVKINKGEQDVLNPKGIDCIRPFPGRGIRVWGARTISSDSLWKYINVRRLFIYIEESIEEGTQWVVFEPNDEKLWARVKQTITQFLTRVWKDGALMGSTPEEAFFVKCDKTTMTQDDIDNGRLICMIGIAPVKPAEFVIFRIAQWQGGSAVTE